MNELVKLEFFPSKEILPHIIAKQNSNMWELYEKIRINHERNK